MAGGFKPKKKKPMSKGKGKPSPAMVKRIKAMSGRKRKT